MNGISNFRKKPLYRSFSSITHYEKKRGILNISSKEKILLEILRDSTILFHCCVSGKIFSLFWCFYDREGYKQLETSAQTCFNTLQ
jgi:hypothetical protein